ncbi:MAG: hypothetical protein AB1589_03490 [Cyanobacteriota bacterium]
MKLTTWTKYLPVALAVALVIPTASTQAQVSPVTRTERANYEFPTESYYQRFMRLGYAAMQRQDYTVAADYFKNAFYERPNDRQALIAYTNAIKYFNPTESEPESIQATSGYARYRQLGYNATRQGDDKNGLPHLPQLEEKRSN